MSTTASVVIIDDDTCIGCTKCIAVCPVDAIIGANKQAHTVLSENCIGCNLCIPACPVDCIKIIEVQEMDAEARRQRAQIAKSHHLARKQRLIKQDEQKRIVDANIASQDMKILIAESLLRSKNKKKVFSWATENE